MRSKKVTLYFPHPYWDALEELAPLIGYESAEKLVTWSPLYHFTVNAPHHATAPIAAASPEVQDLVIEDVVGAWKRGEYKHSSFFENAIIDVLKKFNLRMPEDLMGTLVAEAMKNRKKAPKKKAS